MQNRTEIEQNENHVDVNEYNMGFVESIPNKSTVNREGPDLDKPQLDADKEEGFVPSHKLAGSDG